MRLDRLPTLAPLLLAAALVIASPLAAQTYTPAGSDATGADAQNAAPANSGASSNVTPTPVRRVGGGVTPPKLLSGVNPQYSEEARKARVNAIVLVNLIVDAHGLPRNVHILRGVGMGLDENAVAAVKQYTFVPAMENGKPVAVELNIEVNFQIMDPPKVLHSVPLEITDEVRQSHAIGAILVAFIVDTHGNPQNVHILRGFGMGMDERAVEAIKQYKFAPFLQHGKPVAQAATFQLDFNPR